MKQKEIITNVSKFFANSHGLCYRKGTQIICGNSVIDLGKDFWGDFYSLSGNLIIQSFYGQILYKENRYEGYFNYLNTDQFSFISKSDGYLYFEKDGIIIKSPLKKNVASIGVFYIVFNESRIYAYDNKIPSLTLLWEYSLEDLGYYVNSDHEKCLSDVYQFIGVYADLLWVFITPGQFIAINIHNGRLQHHIKGVERSHVMGEAAFYDGEEDMIHIFRTKYFLVPERSLILGLAADRYYEIQLDSPHPVARLWGLEDKMRKMGINKNNVSESSFLAKDELYFNASNQGRFGILNTQTKEIDFFSEPIPIVERKDAWAQLKEIQVSGESVYVLASDQTLHIFQKE